MSHKKKLFLIFLILFSWISVLIFSKYFKVVGYFELWHGAILFLLSFLSFLFEFKIGRGRIGIEPLSLLPVALIFKSPFAVALSAFFGAFFASFLVKEKKKKLLSRIAFSSSFIFPYSLCAFLSYNTKIPVLYLILEFVAITFLIYSLLFFAYIFYHKKPFDANFFITIFGWLVSFLSFSPLIYLEVILYNSYGILGLFFPLLTVGAFVYALKKSAEEIITLEERKKQKSLFSLVKSIIDGTLFQQSSSKIFEKIFSNLKNIIKFDSACLLLWEPFLKENEKFEVYFFGNADLKKEELEKGLKEYSLLFEVPTEEILDEFKKKYPLNKSEPYSRILPLKTSEIYLGFLFFSGKDEEIISEKTKDFLGLLTDTISISFQNNILMRRMEEAKEKLQKDSEVLSKLLNISYEITLKADAQSVLQRIAESLHKILNVRWVLVSTYSKEKKVFCPKAQYGFEKIWERIKGENFPEEKIFFLWKNSRIISKSYIISAEEYIFKKYGKNIPLPLSHPLTTIYIPLKVQEEILGFLLIEGLKFNGDLEEKIALLELFANQASYSLNIINTYEKLHNLSIKDTLTEAYNFRYFKEVLGKEIKKYERLKNSFSIAIMDLDNFKYVNDRFGHLAGDLVLQELVKMINNQIRKDIDMVFRYGGDEFALFFPGVNVDKIKYLLERIKNNISNHKFKIETEGKEYEININISIGGSSFPFHSKDLTNLISFADKALFKAKSEGKNKAKVYGEEF